MEINMIPLSQLDENDWNPNRMEDWQVAQLAERIRVVGFVQPILCRRKRKRWEVVDGAHRVRAARAAGLVEVPAVVTADDAVAAKAQSLAMNRLRGVPDPFLEAQLLADLRESGLADEVLFGLGIAEREVEAMLASLGEFDQSAVDKALAGGDVKWEAQWIVQIDCADEDEQRRILEHCLAEGFKCRALSS